MIIIDTNRDELYTYTARLQQGLFFYLFHVMFLVFVFRCVV